MKILFLDAGKEELRHRDIIEIPRGGEGLLYAVLFEALSESNRGILCALVAVKQQALRLTAGYKYLFKGFHDQPGADVF